MRTGVVGVLVALAGVAGAEPAPLVRYDDGLLTVRIEQVPLDRVVAMLESEVGVEIAGELGDWREVTKRFADVPLPEALDRLLGRQNFILRYGADGAPLVVELRGVPQPRQAAKARGARPSASALTLLAAAPAVALPPSLRTALRADTASPSRLLMAALRQTDDAVREVAARAFLAALESNTQLRAALGRADPASLEPLFRTAPAGRGDVLLADLGRRSRDPVLRGLFVRLRTQLQQERAAHAAGARG